MKNIGINPFAAGDVYIRQGLRKLQKCHAENVFRFSQIIHFSLKSGDLIYIKGNKRCYINEIKDFQISFIYEN